MHAERDARARVRVQGAGAGWGCRVRMRVRVGLSARAYLHAEHVTPASWMQMPTMLTSSAGAPICATTGPARGWVRG